MPVFRERRIQRVLSRLIRVTPPGAARPWRTARSRQTIGKMLDDGISEGDLIAYVEGAAELVRRGREDPQWWSVGNLFGERTLDRWRAKIEHMHEADRKMQATNEHVARLVEQHREENRNAPPPTVQNIELQRAIRTARDAWAPRWQEDDDADDAKQA